MNVERRTTASLLFWCALLNGTLLFLMFLMGKEVLNCAQQWLAPFQKNGLQDIPQDLQLAVTNLRNFLASARIYLAPTIFGVGGVITIGLWLILLQVQKHHSGNIIPTKELDAKRGRMEPFEKNYYSSAAQVLSVLQRKGCLIDFLQKDLSGFDEAQIAATARGIHKNCKDAIEELLELEPILDQEEGSRVTITEGFDVHAIRLVGNVTGQPPFHGILRHRGWKIAKMKLPEVDLDWNMCRIVAPAEVEVNE